MSLLLYYTGKVCEAAGLGLLAYALVFGLTTGNVQQEIRLFVVGVAVFLVGRFLEWWGSERGS